MRLLCFQAKRFRWKTYAKSLIEIADHDIEEEVADAVVVFVHAEKSDEEADRKVAIQRQTVKYVKWLANKREIKNIVIHSFTHLGGETASPDYAETFINTLAQRLSETAYAVWITPFGYLCEWDLSVYGDSVAKVWKEVH
ncbi:MAG TPA: threonyl-tRNA synthetase editing domain-containing protein [Candidatus Binatia bacterium]|jgi:hypothetical protein